MIYVTKRKPSNMSRTPNLLSNAKQNASRRLNRKCKFICRGGPFNNFPLYLTTPGTMPFSISGVTGFYNSEMKWVQYE